MRAWSASTSDTQAVSLLRVVDVQELVRTVRVGLRPEHPGDEELRARELRAEHAHERNRAAAADVHRVTAEHRREARAIDSSSHGANAGAFQPPVADPDSKLTWAP